MANGTDASGGGAAPGTTYTYTPRVFHCTRCNRFDPHLHADQLGIGAIYGEVWVERERAHAKHGNTAMESFPPDDMNRLAILTEEVGEVAKEFNEARHDGRGVDLPALRKELIQVAAMAVAWADAIEPTYELGPA